MQIFGLTIMTKKAVSQMRTNLIEEGAAAGHRHGFAQAKNKYNRVRVVPLPLPFSPEQLAGQEYGSFITPANFGVNEFGECNVAAPSQHGFTQLPFYVNKAQLNHGGDVVCQRADKFSAPWDSEELVPVIVTVLR